MNKDYQQWFNDWIEFTIKTVSDIIEKTWFSETTLNDLQEASKQFINFKKNYYDWN